MQQKREQLSAKGQEADQEQLNLLDEKIEKKEQEKQEQVLREQALTERKQKLSRQNKTFKNNA